MYRVNVARIENSDRLRGAVRNLWVIFAKLWNSGRCANDKMGECVSLLGLFLVFIYMGMWLLGSLFGWDPALVVKIEFGLK